MKRSIPKVSDARDVGRRVLAALERGREKVLYERRRKLELLRRLIEYEARLDAAAGNSEHGRAARISRRLAHAAPERTIYRIFRQSFQSGEKR